MRYISSDSIGSSPGRLLGAELTALRVARQMGLAQLARDSGIAIHDIEALEQGRLGKFTDPDYLAGLLLRLCEIFEIDSGTLTKRIVKLMEDPGNQAPGSRSTVPAPRIRYIYAGIFALALVIPFAGLWWMVRA